MGAQPERGQQGQRPVLGRRGIGSSQGDRDHSVPSRGRVQGVGESAGLPP
jgi:hypothetical protein